MPKITWDGTGERFFEMGDKKGVLYPSDGKGGYEAGVAWNGLTAVTESPDGAEATDLWADDIKYGTMRSAETFKFTIEAYTYPEEFYECDGTATPAEGVYVGQQKRKPFGFSYVSTVGNDEDSELGYKLHLIYNATASPSEKSYATINDSPEAITFSWECDTSPVAVTNYKPTSEITIDSTKVDAAKLKSLEDTLYGSGTSRTSKLPSPDEVLAMFKTT